MNKKMLNTFGGVDKPDSQGKEFIPIVMNHENVERRCDREPCKPDYVPPPPDGEGLFP